MGIFLPKPLKVTIRGGFHENGIKWVEFGEKGSPMVKIPLKYALYSNAWRLVHAKHPFRCYFVEMMLFGEFHENHLKWGTFGVGEENTYCSRKWWKYYQFGTVIACPNAMAAPGTTLHPKTPTL